MIKLGSNNIGKIFLGSNPIGKAYLGSNLVFKSGSSPTPPGPTPSYTLVDYIETDGVAYIDSGVPGNTPRSVELNVTPVLPASGNSYIMGSRKDSGSTRLTFLLVNVNGHGGFALGSQVYNGTDNSVDCSASANNKTMMLVRCSISKGYQAFGIKQSGESSYTTVTYALAVEMTTNPYSIGIFANNNYGNFSVSAAGTRIKHAKIWGSAGYTGDLLFDGVACLYNGEYGLWDNVTNSFFGNAAGSGAFSGPSNS